MEAPSRWGVPAGTERRGLLLFWLTACASSGGGLAWEAYQGWTARPGWASWCLLLSQVVYVALHTAIISSMVLSFRTYQKYKQLIDLSHLHYCLVCHVLKSFCPPSGSPVTPDFIWPHCTILMWNPTVQNLPVWCHFNLWITAIPAHLVLLHNALAFHAPQLPMWHYVMHMAWTAVVPAVLSTLALLVMGRTDMAPGQPESDPWRHSSSAVKAGGSPASDLPTDRLPLSREPSTVSLPAGSNPTICQSRATQALWIVHHMQLYCQSRVGLGIAYAACIALGAAFTRGLLAVQRGQDFTQVKHIELLIIVVSAYAVGRRNVLATIQPQLQGALNLLYDLVPAHIAQALLQQESNSGSSQAAASTRVTSKTSPAMVSSHHSRTSTTGFSISPGTGAEDLPATGREDSSTLAPVSGSLLTQLVHDPSLPLPATPVNSDLAAPESTINTAFTGFHEVDPLAATCHELELVANQLLEAEVSQRPRTSRRHSVTSYSLTGIMDSLKAAVIAPQPGQPPPHAGLPGASVPEALTAHGPGASAVHLASWHDSCSIIFADIVGFTECSMAVTPAEVMAMLNELFERYDSLCMEGSKVYKVETIGDCIMAATGLLHDDPDHAATAVEFGANLVRAARQVLMPHNGQPVRVRVGVHSGKVISGVVGRIRKRYCLFGDTVNTASRMESTSSPGCVHVSSATHDLIVASPQQAKWTFQCRGEIPVKGKGHMTTYFCERASGTM